MNTLVTRQFWIAFIAVFAAACPWGEIRAGEAAKLTPAERKHHVETQAERCFKPLVDGQWAQAIVLGVVDEHGTTVLGYGKQSAERPIPPDGNSLYEIGSITKTFTGILLADLAERGELGLDDPVHKLLPDDIGPLRCGEREMRLVDLATHSSGLPRLPTNFKPADPTQPYADYQTEQLHEFLKEYAKPSLGKSLEKLVAGSKPKWAYSNLGVGLLGHLLERKTGRKYEELVLECICRPLEMTSTRLTLDESLSARLLAGHDSDGKVIKNWQFGCLAPCGGLRSSANDMLKFVSANLELRETPLAAALRKSHEPQYNVNAKLDMGLNWLLLKPDWIYHSGMTGGHNCVVLFSKARKAGLVVLADTTVGGTSELLDKTAFAFLSAVLDEKPATPPPLRATVDVAPDVLEKYTGTYSLVPLISTFTITREENRLYAHLTGQERIRVYPESPTKFFYKAVDAQITFESDDAGKTVRLILHQNGRDLPAPRNQPTPQ